MKSFIIYNIFKLIIRNILKEIYEKDFINEL